MKGATAEWRGPHQSSRWVNRTHCKQHDAVMCPRRASIPGNVEHRRSSLTRLGKNGNVEHRRSSLTRLGKNGIKRAPLSFTGACARQAMKNRLNAALDGNFGVHFQGCQKYLWHPPTTVSFFFRVRRKFVIFYPLMRTYRDCVAQHGKGWLR